MSTKINVVYGTGPLGIATMRALVRRGHRVRMINRSGNRPMDVPKDVEVIAGDAFQADFNRTVTEDASVIYQCAQPPYHHWVDLFPPLQQAILSAASENGAKLIVAENLYMYGDTDGQPIHEGLPYKAHTRKGRVRARMAEALLEAHQTGKATVAIGRGADFYGPGVLGSSLGERTFVPALNGKPAKITGSPDLPHTYTHIDDFGEALAILGENDKALGQAWHVPNPPTLTQRELISLFFKTIGKPVRIRPMGRLMMALGGLFVPQAREMLEMMYEFEKPFMVDSSKFTKAFGDLATPHEEAMKATASWYQAWLELKSDGHKR